MPFDVCNPIWIPVQDGLVVAGFLKDLVVNWALNNLLSGISELVSHSIYYFTNFINNIFVEVVKINNSWVGNVANYTTVLACILVVTLTMRQFFTVYVLECEGDPESDPLDIVVRAAEAIAFACSGTAIFNFMMEFSQVFASEFLESTIPQNFDIAELLLNLHKAVTSPIALFLVVILVIGLVLFFITAGIRGAELILMKILFPIFAADKVTTGRNKWNSFFTSYMITWLGYIVQLLSFQMFSYSLVNLADNGINVFTKDTVICLGWMVLMIRAPRWLQKYCYSSGTADGASRTSRVALSAGYRLGGG